MAPPRVSDPPQVHPSCFFCGLAAGTMQAVLLNPWDRAMYLSILHERRLRVSNNSTNAQQVVKLFAHHSCRFIVFACTSKGLFAAFALRNRAKGEIRAKLTSAAVNAVASAAHHLSKSLRSGFSVLSRASPIRSDSIAVLRSSSMSKTAQGTRLRQWAVTAWWSQRSPRS